MNTPMTEKAAVENDENGKTIHYIRGYESKSYPYEYFPYKFNEP